MPVGGDPSPGAERGGGPEGLPGRGLRETGDLPFKKGMPDDRNEQVDFRGVLEKKKCLFAHFGLLTYPAYLPTVGF